MSTAASAPLSVVAVSGSLHAPSTTALLIDAVVDRLAQERAISATVIDLHTFAADIAAALTGGPVSDAVTAALAQVAAADVLVAATPVYRGSYTGLFKAFIDLVPQAALDGTPVLLAAGGGSDQHSLVIDHELRPVFAFFGAATLPLGVYARAFDFAAAPADDQAAPAASRPATKVITGDALPTAVDRAVRAALPFLPGA